jgi:hypothetical protein
VIAITKASARARCRRPGRSARIARLREGAIGLNFWLGLANDLVLGRQLSAASAWIIATPWRAKTPQHDCREARDNAEYYESQRRDQSQPRDHQPGKNCQERRKSERYGTRAQWDLD